MISEWQTTFDAISDAVWLMDMNCRIQQCNRSARELFGKTEEQMIGRHCWEIAHGATGPISQCPFGPMCRSGRREAADLRLGEKWYRVTVDPIRGISGDLAGAVHIIRDISQRVQAAEALQKAREELEHRVAERTAELANTTDRLQKEMIERTALQGEIFAAGERERERLGQDLHDGLCQLLAGIRCKTERLKEHLAARSPEHARTAQALYKLLTQAMREARGLARGLQPVERVPEGLMHGLLQLSNSTCELFKVRCECRFPRLVRVHDHRVATELYRVAQEAVSNAARHGEPKFIRIGLRQTSHRLILTITNDGKPFRARARVAGLGLKTMRVRAQHIGAALAITAGRPGGTSVKCVLPISGSVLRPAVFTGG